jgi:hypothetical protein
LLFKDIDLNAMYQTKGVNARDAAALGLAKLKDLIDAALSSKCQVVVCDLTMSGESCKNDVRGVWVDEISLDDIVTLGVNDPCPAPLTGRAVEDASALGASDGAKPVAAQLVKVPGASDGAKGASSAGAEAIANKEAAVKDGHAERVKATGSSDGVKTLADEDEAFKHESSDGAEAVAWDVVQEKGNKYIERNGQVLRFTNYGKEPFQLEVGAEETEKGTLVTLCANGTVKYTFAEVPGRDPIFAKVPVTANETKWWCKTCANPDRSCLIHDPEETNMPSGSAL